LTFGGLLIAYGFVRHTTEAALATMRMCQVQVE
jgi:hypothetical protein